MTRFVARPTHVEGASNYAFDEGKDAGNVLIADEGYFRKARKLLYSTTKSPIGGLASCAAPASLDALLPHLFALWFAHSLVDRLLRRRFPMPLARRVNWSAAGVRGRRFLMMTGRQARFKFGDSLHGLLSQCAPFTGDFGLSHARNVRHATVERGDELMQMTELARSNRSSNPLVAGHHPSLWFLTPPTQSAGNASTVFTISGFARVPFRVLLGTAAVRQRP
jgi:hypothetical protein